MNKTMFSIWSLLVLCGGLVATCEEPLLQFKVSGFAIAPLEGKPEAEVHPALKMFLPAFDGFAANVNVQIQMHKGTLQEYVDHSRKELEQLKLTIASEKNEADSFSWEFSGNFQGRELHFYSRALLKGGKIYLVTATGLQTRWEMEGPKLKQCADSLKLVE